MPNLLEKLKIRLAVSVGWSFKGRLPAAIRNFQATEADGVWHLHRGMQRISDPRHKAIIFTHGLEEETHAEEFARAYRHYSDRIMTPATYERADLYGEEDPIWKIFAYVHVGEVDATERFKFIEESLEPGLLREALSTIVADEEGHVDLTHNMLVEMGATDAEIAKEVRRVRVRRLWEHWMRMGKNVVDRIANVGLSVAYFLFGPFLFWFARKRLEHRFVEYDNNRLKRLAESSEDTAQPGGTPPRLEPVGSAQG